MQIVMLVKNTFTHDIRVLREATSLTQNGYSISVIATKAPGLPEIENKDGISIYRVQRPLSRIRAISDPTGSASNKSGAISKLQSVVFSFIKKLSFLPIFEIFNFMLDRRMYNQAIALNPEVIHAHDLETLGIGSKISKDLRIPLVYDSHEMASARNQASQLANRRAENLERTLIVNASQIIMASPGYAKRAQALYKIDQLTIVRNVPRYVERFTQALNLRKIYNLGIDTKIIVHQGAILPNRGIEQTILAVKEMDNVVLIIIGYGAHIVTLKDLVSKLNLQNHVIFHGAVPPDDLISLASSADIGMCTIVGQSDSYKYSMPNKLFEYTMAEIPIVVSDYAEMANFVTLNELGVTCNPLSPSSIRSAISSLISNTEITQKIKENAKRVKKDACWEEEEKLLLGLYASFSS